MHANEPEMAKKWEKEESINEADASVIRKKLLKKFGEDPLYREFILAKTPKEQKKALKTLKSIRGGNAVRLMQKYVKKLQGESIKGKLRNVIRQEIKSINESDLGLTYKKGKTVKVTHKKSGKELVIIDKPNVKREYEKIGYFAEGKINEGFEKYHLGGLLDSKLKKRLERAIKLWSGKVDAVGDDYIKFRMSSSDVSRFPALLKKLDHNKNVWIGDKRKKNIWDRRKNIDKLREAPRPGRMFLRAKHMVFLPGEEIYFDPMTTYFWLMAPKGVGGPDFDQDPIEPSEKYFYQKIIKKLKSKDRAILKKAMRTNPAQKRIRAKQRKEATTSVSVPGYLSPQAFQKSTQNAIDVDDEDDEVKEAYKVDIDKLLQNPKIKKLMKRLNIRKSQSQQGAIQLLNYFATNPHALAAFKKLAVGESMAAPFRRRKSRGLGRPMKVGLNESSWSQPPGWSSPEAKVHVDKDITKMSKHLGKTSHDIIKIMMSGVKGGKYDAMDLQRGMKEGDVRRTHHGEMDFIQELWHKVRDGFRRYSKRGKLR